MTALRKEATLEIAEDGTLQLPQDVLDALGTRTVRLTVTAAGSLSLQPRPRPVYEIEDPEERRKAVAEALGRLAQPTGVVWPDDYNVRDDIYD